MVHGIPNWPKPLFTSKGHYWRNKMALITVSHQFSQDLRISSHLSWLRAASLYTTSAYISHTNNALLVKIEGPVWYTIYLILPWKKLVYRYTKTFGKIEGPLYFYLYLIPVVIRGKTNPSINQPTNGKRTSISTSCEFMEIGDRLCCMFAASGGQIRCLKRRSMWEWVKAK